MKLKEIPAKLAELEMRMLQRVTESGLYGVRETAAIRSDVDMALQRIQKLEDAAPKPKPPAVKLCKDCKHCKPGERTEYRVFLPNKTFPDYKTSLCVRPNSSHTDFRVTGKEGGGYLCKSERNSDSRIFCGPDAKFYEPAI